VSRSPNRRDALRIGVAGTAGGVLPLSAADAAADAAPEATGPRPGPARGPYFDVTRYGAKGDGRTIDSPAINRAVDAAAAAGGGSVHFPAGTFASYSVRLKSNVTLHLADGATLLAAAPWNGSGFDPPGEGAGNPYQDFGHSHWRASRLAKADGAPTFVLRDVTDFAVHQGRPVEAVRMPGHVELREI
jgi:hypothetical protein